jgi:hypothetical protein
MLLGDLRKDLFRVFSGQKGIGKLFQCGHEWIHVGPFNCNDRQRMVMGSVLGDTLPVTRGTQ